MFDDEFLSICANLMFTEGEIKILDYIVQTLLRGGVPTMSLRHKEFGSLCRKVIAMKAGSKGTQNAL